MWGTRAQDTSWADGITELFVCSGFLYICTQISLIITASNSVIAIFLSRKSFKTYLKRSFMYILWNTDTGNSLLKLIPIFTFISRCALPDFNTLNKLHQPIRTNMVRSSEEQRASEPSVKIFFPLNWKHVLSSSEESCTAIVWMRSHSTKTLSNDCFI